MLVEFMNDLDKMVKFFQSHTPQPWRGSDDVLAWPRYDVEDLPYQTQMRADFAGTSEDDNTNIADAFKAWGYDLLDLIENGEGWGSMDPWMGAADGMRKRNAIPDRVVISKVMLVKAVRTDRLPEYTMWFRYNVIW